MAQKRQRNRRGEENTTVVPPPSPVVAASPKRSNGTTATSNDANALPNPQAYADLLKNCRGNNAAGGNNTRRRHTNPRSRKWMNFIDCLGVFIACGIVVLFLMLIWEIVIPTQKQRVYTGALSVSLIPVVLAAWVAIKPNKPIHNRITPIAMVFAIVGGLFPTWLVAGIAALGLFGLGWVTRPGMKVVAVDKDSSATADDDNDEKKKLLAPSSSSTNQSSSSSGTTGGAGGGGMSKRAQQNLAKAALCAILMTVVMLTENFFIWVVSATYQQGWDPRTAPDALQDNGRRVLLHLFYWLDFNKRDVVSMRRVWNIQYALVSSLGIGLLTSDFHPTRQLWSLSCRTILTMTSARFLRTVSFLLTVLPSQNKFCYGNHYPNPPPTEWWDWIMIGMTPNSSGGCNDLIVSGHATVTATMACVTVSLADDHLFSLAVAWLLGMDYLVEVYEGFHYSVDMWMGAVLCGLLWRVWKPIEDTNTDRNAATFQDMMHRFQTDPITVKDAIVYGGPVLISYLQVTVFPEFSTNFIILGYTSYCVFQMITQGFQHYTKHLLFCILYMAIGVYL